MSLLGVNRPGDSWWHRAPAGGKLLGLLVAGVSVVGIPRAMPPGPMAAGVALVFAAAAVAGLLSTRVVDRAVWRAVRPAVVLVLVLGAVQVLVLGPWPALVLVAAVSAMLALAWSVSLTTPVSEMLAAVVAALAPLRRFGVRPERAGLAVALTIRAIPLLADVRRQVVAARSARGARTGLRGLPGTAVPLVVRTLRLADAMGDAVAARGGVDGPDPQPRGDVPAPPTAGPG